MQISKPDLEMLKKMVAAKEQQGGITPMQNVSSFCACVAGQASEILN